MAVIAARDLLERAVDAWTTAQCRSRLGAGVGPLWLLQRPNLFEEIPEAAGALSSSALEKRHYRRGQRLDPEADGVYVVRSGHVRVHRLRNGNARVASAMLGPGQLFGVGDLIGMSDPGYVEITSAAVLLHGPMATFLAALRANADLAEEFPAVLARHLYVLERRIELAHAHRVPMRVAGVLLDLVEETRRSSGIPLITHTHTDIARMAGTTRESVSRVIAFLKQEQVLAGRGALQVIDHERLQALAAEGLAAGRRGRPM